MIDHNFSGISVDYYFQSMSSVKNSDVSDFEWGRFEDAKLVRLIQC